MNREEVIKFIKEYFGVEGKSLWAAFPNYLVFRNARNRKWFGLLGDVERGKLGLPGEGKVDLLVIRCDPLMVGSLIQTGGAYLPAAFFLNFSQTGLHQLVGFFLRFGTGPVQGFLPAGAGVFHQSLLLPVGRLLNVLQNRF